MVGVRSTWLWCGALLLALASSPAEATLIGTGVTVGLSDGAALDRSHSVTVGAGPEILPGDGSNIGALLLPNESIDLADSSIEVALEEGAANGTTGYPAGTRYTFSFSDPSVVITGVDVVLTNVTGVALGSQVTFGPHSVALAIDTLLIGDLPNAVDVGRVLLSLTLAVPEPAALALLACAVLALRLRARA